MGLGVGPQHTSPHLLPHLSLHLPLPPPHPNTLSYISSHTSSYISPSSPQHIFLLFFHLPSPSESVAKLLATCLSTETFY